MTYRREYLRGSAEDMATILRTDAVVSGQTGTYDGVVLTKDFSLLSPDVIEHKSYALGIGQILEESPGGSERMPLTSVVWG